MSNPVYGVDVSQYQGDINWAEVAKTKDFAIIRAGEGLNTIDTKAEYNVREALKAGLDVGLYWATYPKGDLEKPKKEAERFVEFAKKFPGINFPLFPDLENGNEGIKTKEFVRQAITNFCDVVKSSGYRTGIYYNFDYNSRYYGDDFWAEHPDYIRWLAYPDSGATKHPYDIWQYSWKGRVPGIKTDVDLDVVGKDVPPFKRFPVWLLFKFNPKKV